MEESMLYFAYGSNLNEADLTAWCRSQDRDYPLGEKVGNAYLPDTRLLFNYYSEFRQGGILNIHHRMGQATPGCIFHVRPGGWETLDAKEEFAKVHQRITVTAVTEDGRFHEVLTYQVRPDAAVGYFVPPSASYVKIMMDALTAHGLESTMFTAVAEGREPPWTVNHLFVYGTLMEGQSRHHLLRSWGNPTSMCPAKAPGLLFDTGRGYPCLLPEEGKMHWVRGELYCLPNPRKTFEMLDIVEDTRSFRPERSRFRRGIIRVLTADHRSVVAWAYMFGGYTANLRVIPSGDWREVSSGG